MRISQSIPRTIARATSAMAIVVAATATAGPARVTKSAAFPAGYNAIASAKMVAGSPRRSFDIVAYAVADEGGYGRGDAPARPLAIYEIVGGRRRLVARNDHVVLGRDEGGQCDPFDPEDAGGHVVAKGRYFTVENGVACGQHWTSYITFRLDDRQGFVFDNHRRESWSLNTDQRPDAEALVRDGPLTKIRADPAHPVGFAAWRPR